MAIVIPSKNIFSININPVIDNQIDKINITATEIVSNNVYGDVVYREFVNYGQGTENQETSTMKEQDLNSTSKYGFSGANGYFNYRMNCGVAIRDKYFTFNISVPQKLKNYYITKVYQGNNPNTGEPYIAITKNFVETTYIEEVPNAYYCVGIGAAQVYAYLDPDAIKNYNYSNIIKQRQIADIEKLSILFSPNVTSETNLNIGFFSDWTYDDSSVFPLEKLAICTILSGSLDKLMNAVLEKDDFNVSETDLSQIQYIYENENYVFYNVKVLFSREIFAAASLIFYKYSDDIAGKEYPAKVVKSEQKTDRIEINIYGNALSIDLQDVDKQIGNGNKVFSFDGNELIQTTNTPSVENKYQGIIDEWKYGKQALIISCQITDYYDENGNKVIDTSVSGKMIFKDGDVVIPYAYTNKGDKPISYNKNFTPKQFKVVGTRILKSQGGTQELTLVEI